MIDLNGLFVIPDSSAIKAVQYHSDERLLDIHMHDGSVVTYSGVPSNVVDDFFSAKSMGGFFNAKIRNNYPFK